LGILYEALEVIRVTSTKA